LAAAGGVTVGQTFDMEPEFVELFELCRAATMTSIERMYALYKAVEHIVTAGVEGDFAECGVWRGGSAMMMALALRRFGGTDRTIWLYDTFSGMTPPGEQDVQAMSGRSAAAILAGSPKDTEDPFWGIAPRAHVETNLARTGYATENFRFVEGDVLQTLPAHAPAQLALLRLDTDWYASTRHELEILYPRVTSGGVLIVDDYGYWRGAKQAVDEYFARPDVVRPLLHRIDFTGRIGVKA
jgi:O-methyltransferase